MEYFFLLFKNSLADVVKVTFNQGSIVSQELAGLISYKIRVQTILDAVAVNDFVIEKANILHSDYIKDLLFLINLKHKASLISVSAKLKVENIFEATMIIFAFNDIIGTLQLKITINQISKVFVTSGFDNINSIYQVNKKIDAEVTKKTIPTINPGFVGKAGRDVIKEDILISASDFSLISKVISVKEIKHSQDKVTVTIEVFSYISSTKKLTYSIVL